MSAVMSSRMSAILPVSVPRRSASHALTFSPLPSCPRFVECLNRADSDEFGHLFRRCRKTVRIKPGTLSELNRNGVRNGLERCPN